MPTKRAVALIFILLLVPLHSDRAEALPLMKVAFLDVGQGDAIYVEAPNGAQMVVDGGPEGSLAAPLSEVMPFGDRSVNVLMVTNPDTDHYAGFIGLLESGYSAGVVIEPGTHTGTPTHAEFQRLVFEAGIPEVMARRGMTIELDKEHGVTFTVFFPDRDVSAWTTNDGSIEGVLKYGDTQIFFTGDGTKRTERLALAGINAKGVRSDILKVAHHGSTTSSSAELLSAVSPKYAVISSGKGNRYGLPKQATIDALKQSGIEVLRTDALGTIVFVSDGAAFTRSRE